MKTDQWKRQHEDGTVTEGTLVDGKPEGRFREYFASGQIRKEYNYFRGLMHGPQKQYAPDGRCIADFTMTYGTGIYLECWDSGLPKMKRVFEMDEDGFSGVEICYDTEGKHPRSTYLLNGKGVTKKKYERSRNAAA